MGRTQTLGGRVCEADGCERAHYAKGYCQVHWRRWKRDGTPGPAEIAPVHAPRGVCSVEGCGRTHSSKGYCASHYTQFKRKGEAVPFRVSQGITQRGAQLWRLYRIREERYVEMLAEQGGACLICAGTNASGRALAVDHDRSCCPGQNSCGKCIRALLCSKCNFGVGNFADDPALMRKAAEYVDRFAR